MPPLPLAGIRVLDLSRVLAGPLCTMLLGDLGADVIKVERTGRGDDSREWGPPFDEHGQSAYYLSVNRNKLSVAADLRTKRDRDLVAALADGADVVVENFLPGALGRAGIDIEALMAKNARLVWCTITGFGATSLRPGYDFVVQAESGWMSITGDPDGDSMKSGIALADITAGQDAVVAILAALLARERSSTDGRRIWISLADSARAALVNVAQNSLVSNAEPRRWGNAHANLVPYQLFRARDRGIVIAVGNDDQWRACATALGLRDLADDGELATNRGRIANRERVVSRIAVAVAQRPAREWIAELQGAGVACGLVKTVLEAIADARGASPTTGMPSAVGGSVRLPPPELDAHGGLVRRLRWGAFRDAQKGS